MNSLALALVLDRRTVTKRLQSVPSARIRGKVKVYNLADAVPALFGHPTLIAEAELRHRQLVAATERAEVALQTQKGELAPRDEVRRNTATRVDPLIASSPILRDLVVDPGSREPGNSAFRKAFPGGMLVMTGANSPVGLRSLPARYLFMDEVDAFPGDADGEGDPVALAIQRTVTFRGRRKIYLVSTPTLAGHSRIEAAYLESDQRRFFVACLECGERSTIEWAQIRWPEGRRQDAFWACPECDAAHEEHHKPELLARGVWRPTADGDGRTAGFHLSTLYSPFETWGEVALEHGAVYRDPPRLQAWTNNKLGHSFEDQAGEAVEPEPLMARREDWGNLLPDGVAVIVAGIDLQVDRAEMIVLGVGADEEVWVLRHRILWGDPTSPRLWADIDTALAETFPHRRAVSDLAIRAACVDTGGAHTKAAYEYCRIRFARLKLTEPGPGCIHFAKDLDAAYFRQLTSERVTTRFTMGRPVRMWQPKRPGERNEGLDCFAYSLAALHGLIAAGMSLNREAATLADAPLRAAGAPAPAPVPRPTTVKSSWMNW